MTEQSQTYRPVTVGDWIVTYLLLCIPMVNFIMLFVWAFSGGTPISKANWAKATLIWMLVMIIFYIGLAVVIGIIAGMASQM